MSSSSMGREGSRSCAFSDLEYAVSREGYAVSREGYKKNLCAANVSKCQKPIIQPNLKDFLSIPIIPSSVGSVGCEGNIKDILQIWL